MKFRVGILLIIFIAGNMYSCTNKKLENNIKSLEKRVAALERMAGVASASSTNGESDAKRPVMAFEQTEYDFGTVNEGDIVEYTFKFKNTGDFPLIINKATATCGCTVPEWPKDPIGVGESGEIKVRFNTRNKPNHQTKYVTISANTKPELTRLKITGNVIPANKTK